MDDPIKVEMLPDSTTTRTELSSIGRLDMDTYRGPIGANEVPGLMTMIMGKDDETSSIIVLLYEQYASGGVGIFNQLDARGARNVAASLLHLAAMLDSTAGVQ